MKNFAMTLACIVLVGAGCSRQSTETTISPAAQAPTATAGAAAAPTTAAPVAQAAAVAPTDPTAAVPAPVVTEPPVVPGVPNISVRWADPKSVKIGWKENGIGLKAHKKKKFETAIEHYLKALKSDPATLFARYNLACAMALTGQADAAIGLLEQFRAVGCVRCLKRLVAARTDPDFDSIRHLPRFQAAVGGFEVSEPNYRAAAEELGRAFARKDFSSIQQSIDAGLFVAIKGVYDDLTGEGNQPTDSYELVTSRDVAVFSQRFELTEEQKEYGVSVELHGADIKRCKDECCEFQIMCGGAADLSSVLSEVCFWPASPTVALPVKIHYFTCGG